jgi:hypothetical protein
MASAALANPAPMDPAMAAPVTGPSKSRLLPSGRVIITPLPIRDFALRQIYTFTGSLTGAFSLF